MGLIAGKSGYAAALSVGLNATSDGPLTTSDYILLAVPSESLEGTLDFGDIITHTSGGYSYSDRSGVVKKPISINRAQIDPQVQASAMAELNAITEKLEDWGLIGADSIYFFIIINSVNKTWKDSNGTVNKFLKCRMRNVKWKIIGANLIEANFNLEDCED